LASKGIFSSETSFIFASSESFSLTRGSFLTSSGAKYSFSCLRAAAEGTTIGADTLCLADKLSTSL
jgi:hypothetical protein